jgi:ATP/maltotriose-dependent transcriptional regulator MalT
MKTHLKNIYRKLKVNDRNQASEIAKAKLLV